MYSRGCERFSSRGQRIVVAALIVIALAGTVSAAGGDGELGFAKQCYGSLNITSTPTGAAVSIDGVNAGSTPFVRSRVPMGPHTLRVSSPMHVDATDTITVSCDQTYSKQYTLAPITTTTPAQYQPPVAVQLQDPVKVQTTVAIAQPVSVIPVQPVHAVNKSQEDGRRLVTLNPGMLPPSITSMTTAPTTIPNPNPQEKRPPGSMLVSIFGRIPFLDAILCGEKKACGENCVDLMTDAENCGSCGNLCDYGDKCMNGECSFGCAAGLEQCAYTCTDLTTDPDNCGKCGNACSAGSRCLLGACVNQKGPDMINLRLSPQITQERYVSIPGTYFKMNVPGGASYFNYKPGDISADPTGWIIGTNSIVCVHDETMGSIQPVLDSTEACAEDDTTWITLDYRVRMKVDTVQFKDRVKKATLKMKVVQSAGFWGGIVQPRQDIEFVWYKKTDPFPASFPDAFDNLDQSVGMYLSDIYADGGKEWGTNPNGAKATWDSSSSTLTIDMTDLVNDWITGTKGNHGLILKGGASHGGGTAHYSYYSFESFEVER